MSTAACCRPAGTGSARAIYIAGSGVDFEVLEPRGLVAEVRVLAERFGRAAGVPGSA